MISNWNGAICFLRICLLLVASSSVSSASVPDPPWRDMDYRVAFVKDLISSREANVYYDPQFYNFTAFIVDDRSLVFAVGSKGTLYVLDGRNLEKVKIKDFAKEKKKLLLCTDCKNDVYISVAITDPHTHNLILCFTFAWDRPIQARPLCETYGTKTLDFSYWSSSFDSLGFAPYSALSDNTFLSTREKFLYVGEPVTDKTDFRIIKRPYPTPKGHIPKNDSLGTPQGDSRYFNGRADFIASFETADSVFFVFREDSQEQMMCCKRQERVTRIARICKNDPGGTGSKYPSRNNFITFLKASLVCPIGDGRTFWFEEVHSVFWDEQHQLLYAVFSTPDASPSGTGICLFDMSAFNDAFSGPYKREMGSSLWKLQKNSRPLDCSVLQNKTVNELRKWREKQSPMAYSYRLMANAVVPQRGKATISRFGERWKRIVVDRPMLPKDEKRSITVIFVATERGSILKLAHITATKTCKVEEMRFGDPDEKVLTMRLFVVKDRSTNRKKRYVLLGTTKRVLKLPVQRCGRFKTKTACLLARDPYCGWDPNNEECTTYNRRDHKVWTQELSGCPDKKHPYNPRWTSWSTWNACPTVRSVARGRHRVGAEGPSCYCRQQKCLHPDLCQEEASADKLRGSSPAAVTVKMQVTNCTVNGEWSPWSFWSSCSASCGPGTRQRRRSCSNPSPKFGGGPCPTTDKKKEVQPCQQTSCAEVATRSYGTWSRWSPWNACSTRCGEGFRHRNRYCITSPTEAGRQHCIGDSQQWSACPARRTCPILKKFSEWTQWLRDDSLPKSGFQFVKKRFQFVCAATVSDPKRIEIAKVIVQEQYCQNSDCSRKEKRIIIDQNGGWSEWSPWSGCSNTCGSGMQERFRRCDKPYPSGSGRPCVGNSREARPCRKRPCQLWSCWSNWGSCGADCAQKRTRRCRAEYGTACEGQRQETRSCTGDSCQVDIYWTKWTRWSDCTAQGTQLRDRQCTPGKVCYGSNREFKSCFLVAKTALTTRGGFGILHLILTGCIAFLIGSLITGLIVICVCRPRYLRLSAQLQRARARMASSYPLSSTSSPPPSLSASLQRPNNLRIVNNIHSNPRALESSSSSTAPLLPPRRNLLASSGASTIGSPNRLYAGHNLASTGPPLPPRLSSTALSRREPSISLCKEDAL